MSIIQSLYGEEHEYKVNGATYIVSVAFKHTGRKEDNTSFPTCVKRIINSDFAHLIITKENDTMAAENVCSAVGKEDNIAVEKEGGKKNYTQRIVIYHRFVGYLELPLEDENYKVNTRKGVDVEYIPTAKSA